MQGKFLAARVLSAAVSIAALFGASPIAEAYAQHAQDAETTPTPAPAQIQQSGLRVYVPVASRDFIDLESNPVGQRPNATPVPTATPFPTAGPGVSARFSLEQEDGASWVRVEGPGLVLTLPEIAAAATAANLVLPGGPLLAESSPKVWRLGHNLRIGKGVTLRITGDTCVWLQIRSNPTGASYDRGSFSALDSVDGAIYIANSKVTSWDFVANNAPDITPKNGRAFLRVQGSARMDIISSEIAFLGNPDGDGSYGLSWRDETKDASGKLVGGVTGSVLNSDIHHNYYGFFSYAASGMLIKGNKFRNNDSYGFDPHDFSFSFVVEDNEAFDNGNHGFIISRGCYDFIIRRNKSYRNVYRVDSRGFRAHGFMIDPGGLTSTGGKYTPSINNVLDSNEAYDNQGYGLRLLDGNFNLIINNTFRNNLRGVTIERNSNNNTLIGNRILNNQDAGLQVLGDPVNDKGDSNNNYFAYNLIQGNPRVGVQLDDRVNNNILVNNYIASNGVGIYANAQTRLNRWNNNFVAGNGAAIALSAGGNRDINPPYDLAAVGSRLTGKARPFAIIEVYSDDGGQLRVREGYTTADAAGNWVFNNSGPWDGARISATATDFTRGTSGQSAAIARP